LQPIARIGAKGGRFNHAVFPDFASHALWFAVYAYVGIVTGETEMEYGKHLWKSLLIGSMLAGSVSAVQGEEEPVATGTRGDRIDLYEEQGSVCPEGLKRAVYTFMLPHPLAGETVEGCWRADTTRVFMAFVDGDRGAVDLDAFTWRRRPAETQL
jgi:hypothetical protein